MSICLKIANLIAGVEVRAHFFDESIFRLKWNSIGQVQNFATRLWKQLGIA